MRQPPFIVLAVLIVTATIYVWTTTAQLPDPIATHFGPGNRADGWMTHRDYRLFMTAFLVAFPAFMLFMIGVLPRMIPRWVNIPNRAFWLDPGQLEESMRYLFAHGCWFACMLVLMLAGVHHAILLAHRSTPPMLPLPLFLPLIGGFLLGVVVWIVILHRRFRKPS